MAQRPPVRGFMNGTGNAMYLCLGGIPSKFEAWSLDGNPTDFFVWDRCMIHDTLTCEGVGFATALDDTVDYTTGEGVAPYHGGDLMTSSNQTTTTYGDGIYVKPDGNNYKHYGTNAGGIAGDASTADITDWTLGVGGTTCTGNFNSDVTGTYIGPGSRIVIKTDDNTRVYEHCAIRALAAGAGGAANEVTLTAPVPTGDVLFIGGQHGCVPVPIGDTTTPGLYIAHTTLFNVSDEKFGFVAYFD